MNFKLDSHNVLFVLGLLISAASAVAQQLGTDSKYGLILGAIVTVASQLRSFVEAYKVPDAPTTVVNVPSNLPSSTAVQVRAAVDSVIADIKARPTVVAPIQSGTPDVPPKG